MAQLPADEPSYTKDALIESTTTYTTKASADSLSIQTTWGPVNDACDLGGTGWIKDVKAASQAAVIAASQTVADCRDVEVASLAADITKISDLFPVIRFQRFGQPFFDLAVTKLLNAGDDIKAALAAGELMDKELTAPALATQADLLRTTVLPALQALESEWRAMLRALQVADPMKYEAAVFAWLVNQ